MIHAPRPSVRRITIALAGATLLLSGCARHHPVAAVAEAPPAPPPPRPVLAATYETVTLPPLDSDGRYRTINADIDAQQAIWHVRAALNVAAISCRGPESPAIVQAYNTLVVGRRKLLAAANASVTAGFKAREGKTWQAADDAYMTRLYNFFAMPLAKPGFCAAAAIIAPQAANTPDADFPAFAAPALATLETPFLDVFRTIANYHVEVAAWDARYGPNAPATAVAVAVAVSAPASGATPQLAYADVRTVLRWEPRATQAMALR